MDHYHHHHQQQQLGENSSRSNFMFSAAPNSLYGHNSVNCSGNMERHGTDVAVSCMMGLMSRQEDTGIHGRQSLPIHHPFQSECFLSDNQDQSLGSVKTEGGSELQYRSENSHLSLMVKGQRSVQSSQQAGNSDEADAIKSKIIAHPQYCSLLEAYMDCQKVGAPPDVVARLSGISRELENQQHSGSCRSPGTDPELDQFMEAYYDMLVKYREELTRPLQEAMEFMTRMESQLNTLSNGAARIFSLDEKGECVGSSEEDQDGSGGEAELPEIDPRAEDRELKHHLLKKYGGYLSSLKQELSKKKKKGKLPKDARQKLLNWWELHYKWPYPSETEKVALAESTGLDQKQINNWFINQRKRHWKPSEDMQFVVMDAHHSQNAGFYIEGHHMGDGSYRLGP